MGGFCRALEDMQTAYRIAMQIGDPALELQVYMLLSELFERLQDSEKATRYAAKAYDLSRSLQVINLQDYFCTHPSQPASQLSAVVAAAATNIPQLSP